MNATETPTKPKRRLKMATPRFKHRPRTRRITHTSGAWSWSKDLLESKIQQGPEDSCWTWQGATGPYGPLMGAWKNDHRQMTQARRLIWMTYHEISLDNLQVRHTCGNKDCVNVNHMALQEDRRHLGNFASKDNE